MVDKVQWARSKISEYVAGSVLLEYFDRVVKNTGSGVTHYHEDDPFHGIETEYKSLGIRLIFDNEDDGLPGLTVFGKGDDPVFLVDIDFEDGKLRVTTSDELDCLGPERIVDIITHIKDLEALYRETGLLPEEKRHSEEAPKA